MTAALTRFRVMAYIVGVFLLVLVFVAMPLAGVLWVMPAFAWVTRVAMRAFAVVLLASARI